MASPRPTNGAGKSAKRSTTRSSPKRVTIGGIAEPDWADLLNEPGERSLASYRWRRVAGEMDQLQILSLANDHALQRLVIAYLNYDRSSRAVAVDGLVIEPAKDNPKAIAPAVGPLSCDARG